MTMTPEIKMSKPKLKDCPACGGIAGINRDDSVFIGQHYTDRYPEKVAEQDHGYQVRCGRCGLQTCWWHYEQEAIDAWNRRCEPERTTDWYLERLP